jgi:UDP-N-acetylmuramate-alanine ligase
MRVAWAPRREDAARIVRGWWRPGDLVLTAGAGDVDAVAHALVAGDG